MISVVCRPCTAAMEHLRFSSTDIIASRVCVGVVMVMVVVGRGGGGGGLVAKSWAQNHMPGCEFELGSHLAPVVSLSLGHTLHLL
jgi:hypothetical protein